MAKKENNTNLMELLLHCMSEADPMLAMLEWLCEQLMEAEITSKVGAGKSEHTPGRGTYRSGYRPRRFDTRMGTIYLMVPKVRKGGYIPFFVSDRKRSEAALVQVIQEAMVNGVSGRKMERLAKSLGIENLSRGQVSNMAKELDEQVEAFRNRSLEEQAYPVLWVDALYEKVRYDGRVVNMAILLVCGVDDEGHRQVLAIEPMLEESKEVYVQLFRSLQVRGLRTPRLIISDAHAGLVGAIRHSFPGASWQRCKVHFMRNVLAHVPHKEKAFFAAKLKQIWLAPDRESAQQLADRLVEQYESRFPKAIQTLLDGLEDSLQFFAFPALDSRKIATTNMLERLNKEVRRRTKVVGIFPNTAAYLRLVTSYLMEYAEDWSVARPYLSSHSIQKTLSSVA